MKTRVIVICMLFICFVIKGSIAQETTMDSEGSTIIQLKDNLVENLSGDFTATFQNTPVKDVFRIFALQSGLNIMVSPNIKNNVTANFTKVSIKDAFLAILSANSIYYLVQGAIVKIMTLHEYKNELLRNYVTTKVYDASIIDIKNLPVILKPLLSPGVGNFAIDTQSSKIIITDIKDNFDRLDKLFKELASLPKLVEIETKIVEIDFSDANQVGINWSALNIQGMGNISLTTMVSNGINSASALNVSAHYMDPLGMTADALLSLIGQDHKTRLISQPRILAINREEAVIHIGGKTPYISSVIRSQTTSDVTSQVAFIDIGIKITVTPMITPDDEIKIDLKGEVTSADLINLSTDVKAPQITTTEISCMPIVKDNQPIIIGGLLKTTVTRDRTGVPILKDIPLINLLFSYTADTITRSEMVIFITPRLIKDGKSNITFKAVSDNVLNEVGMTNTNK